MTTSTMVVMRSGTSFDTTAPFEAPAVPPARVIPLADKFSTQPGAFGREPSVSRERSLRSLGCPAREGGGYGDDEASGLASPVCWAGIGAASTGYRRCGRSGSLHARLADRLYEARDGAGPGWVRAGHGLGSGEGARAALPSAPAPRRTGRVSVQVHATETGTPNGAAGPKGHPA